MRRRASGPGAIVLGATYRALGVVRSLGRRGIPVVVVKTDEHLIAAGSRYVRGRGRMPLADAGRQVQFLLDLPRREGDERWVLMATDDESAALVARHREELGARFVTTTPGWDVMRWAYDKRLTHQLGVDAGVPVPATWLPADADEVAGLRPAFPVILKPASKYPGDPLSAAKAWRIEDHDALVARYAEARRALPADAVMVQDLIPGTEGSAQLAFGALCAGGEPLATVTARRTRQRPMDFGKASTFVETIEDDAVRTLAERVLRHLGYTGIVEVEFKRDPRDGELKLLDVNPRTWGWQSLGAAAGVDFPYLDWLLAREHDVPRVDARPGVRWIRLSTDLPTVAGEVVAGRLGLGAALRSYRPPVAMATLAADDPLPALFDLPVLGTLAARRRLRARRKHRDGR